MKYPAVLLAALALAWEPGTSVPGIFDLGGPRSDGSLLAAGVAELYRIAPDGTISRFTGGADAGGEPYIAVSPGLHVAGASCDFTKDETYILRLHAPIGITRLSADGQQSTSFVNLNLPGLSGIVFDDVGSFGHRLLATGSVNGKTEVVAIDCAGGVQVITRTAPIFEGGIAVAPLSFGAYGGDLIAPDEISGVVWAIAPDGTSHQLVDPGLPKGGDVGVESVGFVPSGFSRGGYVYYSDRATPGNPHPGTDHVLRLSSADLVAAGMRDGDLLVATEGGASLIDVRCDTSCGVVTLVGTPTTAHGEGHFVFRLSPVAAPSPRPSPKPSPPAAPAPRGVPPAVWIALAAGVLAALAAVALRRR